MYNSLNVGKQCSLSVLITRYYCNWWLSLLFIYRAVKSLISFATSFRCCALLPVAGLAAVALPMYLF